MKENYYIETTNITIHFFVMLLVAIITSIIPMLINNFPIIHYTTMPFFITIVILFGFIMYYRWCGLAVGVITFVFYAAILGFSQKFDSSNNVIFKVLLINTIANSLQLILIFIAFLIIKKLNRSNKNRYAQGTFYLSKYNSFLFLLFFSYLIVCLTNWMSQKITIILIAFSCTILIATIIKIIIESDIHLLCYTLLIAIVPSTIACIVSVIANKIPHQHVFKYMVLWILSNYILLQACGYILFQLFYNKQARIPRKDERKQIDISTVCYYFATLIWNIIIIYMFYTKKLGTNNNLIYLFPWMLGNAFLCANLFFSRYSDTGNVPDKFKWFEQRVIIVEKNTTGIITIISFLLPLGVNFLRNDIPDTILFLFIFNIFSACLSVGIIWVPGTNLKFIALLKTLKTIFYLYSITFLLVSVIMLMQLLQNTDISKITGQF